jgi:[acyl-carrier-protein] S-malonyltransferase
VVVVANHNSSNQVAISGEIAAVDAACEALKAAGAKRALRLNVSGAFHSPLLAGAAASFADHLAAVALADPEAPLVANVTAAPSTTAAALRDGFRRQLVSPVRWHEGLAVLLGGAADGRRPRVVLEVGPGKVLSNLAKREHPEVTFLAVGTAEELDNALDSVRALLA